MIVPHSLDSLARKRLKWSDVAIMGEPQDVNVRSDPERVRRKLQRATTCDSYFTRSTAL
jgi:hypothetical protein